MIEIFLGLALGIILGAVVIYFYLKSSQVSRNIFEETQQNLVKKETEFYNAEYKIQELQNSLLSEKNKTSQLGEAQTSLKNEYIKIQTEKDLLQQQFSNSEEKLKTLELKISNLLNENQKYLAEISRLKAQNESLNHSMNEQKIAIEKLQEESKLQFENIANKILEEKTEKFTSHNKENIQNLLTPLQEKILNFEKKIENTHKESIDQHSALRQQILNLRELNQQMSKEALNLTKALKGDNKIQGNWGELILEKVLEKSGLEKGREYDTQKSHSTEKGRFQPDVIINLPDGKKMIIDSKVSLNAYERFINEEDAELQKSHLKEHILSLNKHIEQLSNKNYQNLYEIESPDFVLLFIPIEPAFAIALNEESQLYNKAFEKNIVIVTPSTLLATLKTIDSMWSNQKRQDNAIEIARQAGALYDKFEGFVSDLINIGKKMDGAKSDYEKAMNKLVDGRGNLVRSAERLKEMGAKASKNLPENLVSRANNE